MGDYMKIYGQDEDAIVRDTEVRIQEAERAYFEEPLVYRVELHSLSGLGFQGSVDYHCIETASHADADLQSVLDYINSAFIGIILRRDETYFCRLVSLNEEGQKYVWSTHKLSYNAQWSLSKWNS